MNPERWWARALLATVVALASGSIAQAQVGLGHLEDAAVAPRGAFRLRAITAWSRFDTRFATAGVEPLGGPFTSDSLGARQIAALGVIDSLVSATTAQPFTMSLGRSRLDAVGRHEVVPIGIEYGLTSRITVGVLVPIVRHRVMVQFRLDSAGATLGPNLHRTQTNAQQNNVLVQTQFASAMNQLQARLASCEADPSAAGCSSLLARQDEAQALLAASQGFMSGVATLYGDASTTGMAFVPTQQSAAHTAIGLRIADFNVQYRDLLGSGSDLITAIPTPAAGPAGTSNVQRYLTTELGGDSLATEERTGFGDIEIGAKMLLFDRPTSETARVGARFSVYAAARLPTSSQDSPSPLADLRLGDDRPMIEARAALDLQSGRVGLLASGDATVALEEDPLRDGRWIGVHLAPRIHLSPPMAFHGAYSFRQASLGGSEQFVGGGVSYSTYGLHRDGGPLPVEMRYTHLESLKGPAGQPKYVRDQLELRIYFRLWR